MNRHHSYEEKLVELGMGRGSFFLARRAVFLLSLISRHEMVRMGLVMADGSLLTVRQYQQQTQIL